MNEPSAAELVRRYSAITTADVAGSVAFRSGSGLTITDTAGREYLDFIAGYGVVNTGWQRPEILAAHRRTLKTTPPMRKVVALEDASEAAPSTNAGRGSDDEP